MLSEDKAAYEAMVMTRDNHLWVCEVKTPGRDFELASIVATTRVTETVAAVTKVFTSPKWRSQGYAGQLMRFVCRQ